MIIRLIVSGVALAVAGVVGWFLRSKLWSYARAVYYWTAGSSEFWGLAGTFWNEAAVLWFVFPVLDDFYERSNDKPPLTTKAIIGSFVLAGVFFLAAVYSEKMKLKLEKKKGGT